MAQGTFIGLLLPLYPPPSSRLYTFPKLGFIDVAPQRAKPLPFPQTYTRSILQASKGIDKHPWISGNKAMRHCLLWDPLSNQWPEQDDRGQERFCSLPQREGRTRREGGLSWLDEVRITHRNSPSDHDFQQPRIDVVCLMLLLAASLVSSHLGVRKGYEDYLANRTLVLSAFLGIYISKRLERRQRLPIAHMPETRSY